jgi:Tfp pilus assembly protein PilV
MIGRRERACAQAKPNRRGISLIEMLVMMTIVSVALGLSATTIQLLLRLKADAHSRYSANVVLERLARQLRSDVHAAASAQVEGAPDKKPPGLRLDLRAKRMVIYEAKNSAVVRIESQAGQIMRREVYSLPAARAAEFAIRPEAGRQFVAVVVKGTNLTHGVGSASTLEILALLDKEQSNLAKERGGPSR